jgi:Lrp/AsnC family leucine-responsive transcriptional regulator
MLPGLGRFRLPVKERIHDIGSYRELLGQVLLNLPHVRSSRTLVVMEELKETTGLAIEEV